MKSKYIAILKKNIHHVLMIVFAIIIIVYSIRRERRISSMAENLTELRVSYEDLQKDRDFYKSEYELLQKDFKDIARERDSISLIEKTLRAQLKAMQVKHRREIDSLLNIPDDTVFVRLQPIYPRPALEPLNYPFSGSQIRQIYSVSLNHVALQKEHVLQGNILKSCADVNEKYRLSEQNLLGQINLLNKNISACDEQLGLKDKEVKLTQKQLKQKTFWNWTFKGALIIIGGYAIIK